MTWDTVALIGRAHQGDKEARDILFHENTGLIYSVAHRFLGRGAEMEDLFQIGSIGLLKAVDKFDLSYDVKFSTYAVPMIAGEIKRFLRDDGMLKVSRSIKENQYRIYKMREKLEKNLGREPTVTELAEELGMTPEEIAMASDAATEVESIYRPIHQMFFSTGNCQPASIYIYGYIVNDIISTKHTTNYSTEGNRRIINKTICSIIA